MLNGTLHYLQRPILVLPSEQEQDRQTPENRYERPINERHPTHAKKNAVAAEP